MRHARNVRALQPVRDVLKKFLDHWPYQLDALHYYCPPVSSSSVSLQEAPDVIVHRTTD